MRLGYAYKMLSALDRLRLFLRPPGRGIYIHSTGGGYASPLLMRLYGTDKSPEVQEAWEDSIQKIRRVKTVLVGLPSDTGASIIRGANFGPLGVRLAYLERYRSYPKQVLDIGDVFVVPQLLHDEMLSESQLTRTRSEIFPDISEPLPVSPLSIAESVFELLSQLNPQVKIVVIGGDHSVSWPAVQQARKNFGENLGLLHFDAHTDLLESRLGIRYCFATWAFHAMKLLKPHHMVQVGIRTSAHTRDYWASHVPVWQVWANEVRGHETEIIQKIIDFFKEKEIQDIYISNDIDGTDAPSAPATGTPEMGGLDPKFVLSLLRAMRTEFHIVGGDVVEVAPPLSGRREDFAHEPTCQVAADYLHELIED